MSQNKPIQLGLCCLNIELRSRRPTVFASRSMIMRTVKEKGIETLKTKILQNLADILVMMDWNEAHGIKVFRLSSEIFPHKTNPGIDDYTYDFAHQALQAIGQKSRELNQRLTFHPGHFNVLASPNLEAFKHTLNDLQYHADLLDLMGLDQHSVMVIHGGGTYKDKEATINRWIERYQELPESIRRRLVLENCEKNFSIEDCLRISQTTGVPVVFDVFHHDCYRQLHPEASLQAPEAYIESILKTWQLKSIKPKFHVSEQGTGRIGHHSDYISHLPEYLLKIPEHYNTEIDIMIEAKQKEKAIFGLYRKYPELNCRKLLRFNPPRLRTQVNEDTLKPDESFKLDESPDDLQPVS